MGSDSIEWESINEANDDGMLVSKYRPKSISDMIGQAQHVAIGQRIIKGKRIVHTLLHGPPGVGKTTWAECVVRGIYGDNLKDYWWKSINAANLSKSELQNLIENFVLRGAFVPSPVPYKTVIVDESEKLQLVETSMRTLMEQHISLARFILICNDITKISEPIQSRCSLTLEFGQIPRPLISQKLNQIRVQEGIVITQQQTDDIISATKGDLRKAIGRLEAYL
jgi:DNA polymerase III delta prime subunit